MREVIINEMTNLPHHEGQLVLEAERDDFGVKIKCEQGTYWIYGLVKEPSGGGWTRLAAPLATVTDVTELARRLWRDGKDFNTVTSPVAEIRKP
ncbi:MAG TPA: hypothetical protein VGG64_28325 [Pirellulales bacterium]|jgi:hypothetical protein